MRIIQNSQGHNVAVIDSDIIDLVQSATGASITTITEPTVQDRDINLFNYGASNWALAPDQESGIKLENGLAGIFVEAGSSISLRYDSVAKNFIITGDSKIEQTEQPPVDLSGYATTQYVTTELAKKQNVFLAGTNLSFGLDTQGRLVLNCTATGGNNGTGFDPMVNTIGPVSPTNDEVVSDMTVNAAINAMLGAIAMLPLNDSVNYTDNQASYAINQGGKNGRNHNIKTNQADIEFVLSGFNDANNAYISIDNTATTASLEFSGVDPEFLYIVLEGIRQPQGTTTVELQGSAVSNYRIDIERFSAEKYYVFVVKMRD